MKLALIFALIALLPAAAQDAATAQRIVTVSPDHRYEVIVADGAWGVRDTRTRAMLASPDLDPPYAPASGGAALWSPDSLKVVFAYQVNKSGGNEYFALAIDGPNMVPLHLPDDAIPIKWTAASTLLCSVRTGVALTLDPKTGAFNKTGSR